MLYLNYQNGGKILSIEKGIEVDIKEKMTQELMARFLKLII